MGKKYEDLANALKNLEQTEGQAVFKLPMAEDEWNTRPDTVSYGFFSWDFEESQLEGNDRKLDRSYNGTVDLFSMAKSGAGWVEMIEDTLTECCGASWELNSHQFERDTGLTHWEWVFSIAR